MHEKYMEIAIDLARRGRGKVSPNPMVGAIIVKEDKIIGKGYHMKYGENHAEINALENATESVENATMYVTLEPCSHYGKTPPCVDVIIKNKISKVVIGSLDPNPLVSGKSVKKLRENNIEVIIGVLEEQCIKLNEVFIKYISTNMPFVIMKCAMSLDGKIATSSGESKWISCEESRKDVHKLRGEVSGIMVGIDTVIKDDPQLTCRIENLKSPIRIIVDTNLRVPIESKVITDLSTSKTIIATANNADKEKINLLKNHGVEILVCNKKNEKVDLVDLMKKLGKLNIDSILLEGGATLNYSALEANVVDKIQFYIAPKIIGGGNSKTPVGGSGIGELKDAYKIKELNTRMIDEDIFLECYIDKEELLTCSQA